MEQWQSEQINELVAAIVAAQLKMAPAKKETVNPFYHRKYADLPTCWDAIVSFREAGVAIVQSPMEGPDGYVMLDTQLSHISGQWMRSRLKIRIAKDDPQGYGSAITYARRYALGCMTGLVTEEDDDGNSASNPQQTYQRNKATAQSKIAELRQEATKPGVQAAGGDGESRPTVSPQASDSTPGPNPAVSDEDWRLFVEYCDEDDDRGEVKDEAKKLFACTDLRKLPVVKRLDFILKVQDMAAKRGVMFATWVEAQ